MLSWCYFIYFILTCSWCYFKTHLFDHIILIHLKKYKNTKYENNAHVISKVTSQHSDIVYYPLDCHIRSFPCVSLSHVEVFLEAEWGRRDENLGCPAIYSNIFNLMALVWSEKLEIESGSSEAARVMSQPGCEGQHCWLPVLN